MADEIASLWEAKREKLQRRVATAVLDLFAHMGGAAAFIAPLDKNTPDLVVAAGLRDEVIRELVRWGEAPIATEAPPAPGATPMSDARKSHAHVTAAAQATCDALVAMTRALKAGDRQEFAREVEEARSRLVAAQAELGPRQA